MKTTRGEANISWIQDYCRHPNGPRKGQPTVLTMPECDLVRRIYDGPDGCRPLPVTDVALASYLILLHVCGFEGKRGDEFKPDCSVADPWTVWTSTSPEIREVLVRKGGVIVCRELGTRWTPTVATAAAQGS